MTQLEMKAVFGVFQAMKMKSLDYHTMTTATTTKKNTSQDCEYQEFILEDFY